ncbi:hypothetical protein [Mameliella sp. MMSF_3455]|uniref:hypothetical protein n=1 Tax=Mameliella sp. MMSF_3455 TaxID=3046714 RepID=UPI00273DFE8D|nr:hypothetical protein [Mameliella sp. MMSF_3455]
MDDMVAAEMNDKLDGIREALDRQNRLQADTNELLRSLIPVLQGTAQEVNDLRERLEKPKV